MQVTTGDLNAWVMGQAQKTSISAIIGGFLFAAFLLFIAFALFAGKRRLLGMLAFISGIVVMLNVSALITVALCAVVATIVGLMLVRKKGVLGTAVTVLAVSILVFAGVKLYSQHRGPYTLFSPVFGGKAVSCASILDDHRNGVFLSTKPGLVLWSFGKTGPLDQHEAEIREFALDSDLILGAVFSSDQIGILARERTTPIDALPPLRTETILQLAAAHEDELAQSYERDNLFAGRYDERDNMDWAPIYLSPRLIDTEYGSLMNITDQLLKGWSEHDEIKYVNFTYTKPTVYPFSKALSEILGAKSLTFNWNTKGAGYVIKMGNYEIYALNQTGPLPIDYLAKGNSGVESAEDTAYKYYSNMSDPNLIRVVQYAAIYQIFHHYSVVASANSTPSPAALPSPLRDFTRIELRQISEMSDADLNDFIDPEDRRKAHAVRDVLRVLRKNDPDGSLQNALVDAFASRDGLPEINAIQDDDAKKVLFGVLETTEDLSQGFVDPDVRRLALLKYAVVTGDRQSQWIHTPSIVESRGTYTAIGGHNLSAHITTFESDESVSVGQVTVQDDGDSRVIHFNPKDEGRIGDTVRNAAREDGASTDQVRDKVQAVLSADDRKPAALNTALGFDDSIRPDPLRGFEAAHAPHSIDRVGWRPGGEALSSKDAKFLNRIGGNSSRAVLIARESGAYVISAPPAASVQAFDLASATDAFFAVTRDTPEGAVAIHFRGFDDRQAEGFMRNVDSHSEVRVSVGSTEEYVSPEKLEEILNGKYDWARAELREEPKLVVAADGRSSEVQATLSVPARETGAPSLLVRLRLTISNAIQFTQDMLTGLGAQIRSVLSGANSDDARVVARALVDELKKDKKFTTVQAQVQHDDKTVFYVQNRNAFKAFKDLPLAA